MKIIHCADIHLDSKMESSLSKEQAKERKKELITTFENMVKYARDNEADIIMIAGDLFDSCHITLNVRRKVESLIKENKNIDFLYLKGNHGRNNFLEDIETIPDNLKLFDSTWKKYIYGDVVISGIELNEENNTKAYDSLILDKDKINIVLMHGQESKYLPKDTAEIVNIRELQNKYIDYLALGHMHEYKYDKLDNRGNYCYSGCLEGRGFQECGDKGFVVLNIVNGIVYHEFVKISKRCFHEIHVDVTELGMLEDISNEIQKKFKDIDEKDIVRIVLEGSITMDSDKDIGYLYRNFRDKVYFLKIFDKTKLAINYEDYKYDVSLKGEFIRLISTLELPQDDKDSIIITGIKALSGEEIDL